MSHVTTHVLDVALGAPARGVAVRLDGADGEVARGRTDADGRVGELGPAELTAGVYRLVVDTGAYFAGAGRETFYPEVVVAFRITGREHYHVPVLLSPFGYSTYRGS